MDKLHNPRLERALVMREIEIPSVDGRYGIVASLQPRCEGIVARFTVRDLSTVPSEVVGERNETFGTAVQHVIRTYDVGHFTASTAVAQAEQAVWRRLYDMGYHVPIEYMGECPVCDGEKHNEDICKGGWS